MARNHDEIFDEAFVTMFVAELRSRAARVDSLGAVLKDQTFMRQTRGKAIAVASAVRDEWIDYQMERFGVKKSGG